MPYDRGTFLGWPTLSSTSEASAFNEQVEGQEEQVAENLDLFWVEDDLLENDVFIDDEVVGGFDAPPPSPSDEMIEEMFQNYFGHLMPFNQLVNDDNIINEDNILNEDNIFQEGNTINEGMDNASSPVLVAPLDNHLNHARNINDIMYGLDPPDSETTQDNVDDNPFDPLLG